MASRGFGLLTIAFLLVASFLGGPAVSVMGEEPPPSQDSSDASLPTALTVEVSRRGFDNTPGEFRLTAVEGEEVEITFIYGDGDLKSNNPHQIFLAGYDIKSAVLDKDNPRATIRFTPTRSGTVRFACVLVCAGHNNLQGGVLEVQAATSSYEAGATSLVLGAPKGGATGKPVVLTALLRDEKGEAVSGMAVRFFVEASFFIEGLMEVGQAVTSSDGTAALEYTPRAGTSEVRVIAKYEGNARYKPSQAAATLQVEGDGPVYRPEIGISLPSLGPETVGLQPVAFGPSGLPFRLTIGPWMVALIVAGIWSVYMVVMHLVFRISQEGEPTARLAPSNRRRVESLVPVFGMVVIFVLAIMLITVIIRGPYTHLLLLP